MTGLGGGKGAALAGAAALAHREPDGFVPKRFADDCVYGIAEDDLAVQAPARACPNG